MKHFPRLLIGAFALLAIGGVALAIQPGTTGTNKEFQQSGFRVAVPVMVNNTATATAGAATLNAAGAGIITSESLTTLPGSDYTLTLTNTMVAAADLVFATVSNGTNTGGGPVVARIQPAAGSVVIIVRNGHTGTATSLNGTIKVGFLVIKQSALGSD